MLDFYFMNTFLPSLYAVNSPSGMWVIKTCRIALEDGKKSTSQADQPYQLIKLRLGYLFILDTSSTKILVFVGGS